jgi:hypothetical protein
MDINIFGYKINLEILILIGIVYLILVGHTVCGCCNFYKIMEGLENMTDALKKSTKPSSTNSIKPSDSNIKVGNTTSSKKEGFTPANTNYGESSNYNLKYNKPVNTSSWSMPNLTVVQGESLSQGVKNILDRPSQPIPLPKDELLIFANTPFKPECCPNSYSNSTGCACMTTDQYNYLITRGGNNLPYSEY